MKSVIYVFTTFTGFPLYDTFHVNKYAPSYKRRGGQYVDKVNIHDYDIDGLVVMSEAYPEQFGVTIDRTVDDMTG